MEDAVLILFSLDSNPFITSDSNNIDLLYNYLDKKEERFKIMTSYSNQNYYYIKKKHLALLDGRQDHKIIFSKSYSKDNSLYSLINRSGDINKNIFFKSIYKNISSIMPVDDIIIIDNKLDIGNDELSRIFEKKPIKIIKSKNDLKKKTLNYTK